MSITISDGTNTLTLTPEKEDVQFDITASLGEAVNGNLYNKTKKVKNIWKYQDVITDAEKTTLINLLDNDYVTLTIGSTPYTCILSVDTCTKIRGYDPVLHKVSITLRERGWT